MAAVSSVPARAYVASFARSFAIQGSWNYRTMLGQGFAFALLPVLRHVHAGEGEDFERALARHADHFNAHPYLAGLALGAVARMEVDGADPEEIRRFKTAVRGPLGGLGDRLVWVGVLPAAILVGLVAAVAGTPIWVPPVLFFGTYNLAHLALRVWAFRVGLQEGPEVAKRLRGAELSRYAEWLSTASTFLVGGLVGLASLSGAEAGLGVDDAVLGASLAGALAIGVGWGQQAWRRALLLTAVVVAGVMLAGGFG